MFSENVANPVYWFVWFVFIILCMLPLISKAVLTAISVKPDAESSKIPSIGCKYRINRIIKSKFNAGDYEVVNKALHHYQFNIDGELVVMGILGINDAISALNEVK